MIISQIRCWDCKFDMVPIAKQSVKKGKFGFYQPKKQTDYQKIFSSIAQAQKPQFLLEGPLKLEVEFCFPFRKNEKKKIIKQGFGFHTERPDCDNLLKPVKDALSKVVYKDDSQVCEILLKKIRGPKSYIKIEIFFLNFVEKGETFGQNLH